MAKPVVNISDCVDENVDLVGVSDAAVCCAFADHEEGDKNS